MKQFTPERSKAMFRRIRYRKRLLVAGLGLAALAAPSAAFSSGSSSTHNMSSTAYQALVAKSQSLNDRYGNAVTALSSKQFIELWKDGGSKYSPEALNQMVVLGQAMNERYGTHNYTRSAYDALVAKSRAMNVRYSSTRYGAPDGWTPFVESLTKRNNVSRYGAPDGWTPYMISLTRQSQSQVTFDGRSPDTKDFAQQAKLLNLAPVDGRSPDTVDAAVQAHSPVVTITKDPGFQWGDFGIGSGVALAAVILLALGVRLLSNRQGRKPTPVATA
jgi:hypothetical protein